MNEISWEDNSKTFTRRFKGEIEGQGVRRQGPSDTQKSYMESYLRRSQQGPVPTGNGSVPARDPYPPFQQGSHFKQQDYQQQDYQQRVTPTPAQPDSRAGHEPEFTHSTQYTDKRNAGSRWRFFDLKNKKQTGDLYRKVVSSNKKNADKVFAFVSSRRKEGVSTILANLVSYANLEASEKRFLIIDANLNAPGLDRVFNIPNNTYGMMDLFNQQASVNEAIVQISLNIFFLGSGIRSRKQAGGGVGADNLQQLMDYCRNSYDYILIDCPPVLSSTDALTIAPVADKTFLIVQAATVQRPVIEQSKTLLQNNECKIEGIILNRVKQVIPYWVYKFI